MNWNEQETVNKENIMMYVEYFSVQQILKYYQFNKRVNVCSLKKKEWNEHQDTSLTDIYKD